MTQQNLALELKRQQNSTWDARRRLALEQYSTKTMLELSQTRKTNLTIQSCEEEIRREKKKNKENELDDSDLQGRDVS